MKFHVSKKLCVLLCVMAVLVSPISCTLFYPIGVIVQGALTREYPQIILEDDGKFQSTLGQRFEKKFLILTPNFSAYPDLEILNPEELPSGVALEVERDPSDTDRTYPQRYILKFSGTAVIPGSHTVSFQLSCCSTMSGPTKVGSGAVTLEVIQ